MGNKPSLKVKLVDEWRGMKKVHVSAKPKHERVLTACS